MKLSTNVFKVGKTMNTAMIKSAGKRYSQGVHFPCFIIVGVAFIIPSVG
jgi:hypothetical protein